MTGPVNYHLRIMTIASQPGSDQHSAFRLATSTPDADLDCTLRHVYLKRLHQICQHSDLTSVGFPTADNQSFALDQLYVAANTTTMVDDATPQDERTQLAAIRPGTEKNKRPMSLLEAAAGCPRLVVTGHAGSGKSSFLRHLISGLTHVSSPRSDAERHNFGDILPIYIQARDLSERLLRATQSGTTLRSDSAADILLDQIRDDMLAMDLKTFERPLFQAIESQGCLIAVDGIDEVAAEVREGAVSAVVAFLRRYKPPRLIITCCPHTYTGTDLLSGFQRYDIAPFRTRQIKRFAANWYGLLGVLGRIKSDRIDERIDDFTTAALSTRLRPLAACPSLLAAIGVLHHQRMALSDHHVQVYDSLVNIMLQRCTPAARNGTCDTPSSSETAVCEQHRCRTVIEAIAFEAHRNAQKDPDNAEVGFQRLVGVLEQKQYLGSAESAAAFLRRFDTCGTLFTGVGGFCEHPGPFRCVNIELQHYLAGCHLINGRDCLHQFAALAPQGDYWADVAQYAGEELLYNRRSRPRLLDIAYSLCPTDLSHVINGEHFVLWAARLASLIDRIHIIHDEGHPDGGKVFIMRLCSHLTSLATGTLKPARRTEAGNLLAHIGDPRREVKHVDQMQFCYIPRGSFWMGSDEYIEEKPLHLNKALRYGYWISRFPITNAQFSEFVDSGCYNDTELWPEAVRGGIWTEGGIKGRSDTQPRKGPHRYDSPFDLSNHPVVGLTWYEALAFTRWLTTRWQEASWLPRNLQVKLPSEAEWEKASRGGVNIPHEPVFVTIEKFIQQASRKVEERDNSRTHFRYPWGDHIELNMANYSINNLDATNPVGCFPLGESPYGCEEMSGNVWEWTRNCWGKVWGKTDFKYPYNPVSGGERLDAPKDILRGLRGGSFMDSAGVVRCAFRHRCSPDNISNGIGFRIVIAM